MRIELRNIGKFYQDADKRLQILDRVNFVFPEDGAVAIVGRSGIGKSTLLHILGALDRPSEGSVLIGETDLASLDREELAVFRGRSIGFVFQGHHLLPEFSALENVAMPLTILGVSDKESHKTAHALLERVGLSRRMHHRPSQLSGGEQQRVAVARALVTKPGVILADEPTGSLDPGTASEVKELLLEIRKETKSIMIVVTHSEEFAKSMDLVLEMSPGGRLDVRHSA